MRSVEATIDKIIAAACGDEESDSSEDEAPVEIKVESGSHSGHGAGTVAVEFDEDSADDEINMGMPGKYYTAADRRLVAKYIATVGDWDSLADSPARFTKFHSRVCVFGVRDPMYRVH